MFSCEFCEISKNTFFAEHLRATFSVNYMGSFRIVTYLTVLKYWNDKYGVESVQIRSYFRFIFFCIQSQCRKIRTRNKSVFRQFSRSESCLTFVVFKPIVKYLWSSVFWYTWNNIGSIIFGLYCFCFLKQYIFQFCYLGVAVGLVMLRDLSIHRIRNVEPLDKLDTKRSPLKIHVEDLAVTVSTLNILFWLSKNCWKMCKVLEHFCLTSVEGKFLIRTDENVLKNYMIWAKL